MLKGIFGKRATTRSDIGIAIGGVIFAVWKAVDTAAQYKRENDPSYDPDKKKESSK